MNECPHCKKDRRDMNEILEEIGEQFYDVIVNLKEDDFEFDSSIIFFGLKAAKEHPHIRYDFIKIAKIQEGLDLIEEFDELWEDYQNQEDENWSMTKDCLNSIIPKIKSFLSEFLAQNPTDPFKMHGE
jgi:hypothetical protein